MGNPVLREEKLYVLIDEITPGVKMPVNIDNEQAALDSTTSPLGIAGTYETSPGVDVQDYDSLLGTCFADQDGTLTIKFSCNDTDYDGEVEYTYTANEKLCFDVDVCGKAAKMAFENTSGVAQTVFRLHIRGKR